MKILQLVVVSLPLIFFVKTAAFTAMFAMALQSVEPFKLHNVREFHKSNLGLFDISFDGHLLLMHQYGRSNDKTTQFKARVLRAQDGREVSSIDIELPTEIGRQDFWQSRQMFFLPESHRVVLVGKRQKSKEEPALLLWTPETGAIERISSLLTKQTFVADVWDRDQLLCYTRQSLAEWPARASDREFFLYSLTTRRATPIDVRNDEFRFGADHPIVRSPDWNKIVGVNGGLENTVQIRDLSTRSVLKLEAPRNSSVVNYRYSTNGDYLVVLSRFREIVPGTENGTKGLSDVPLLAIYESATGRRVVERRILEYIKPYAKKVSVLPAAEHYLVSTGEFMEFSPDSEYLAVSFAVGSRNTGRHSPRVAVFRFPSLDPIGFAQHPEVKIGIGEFIGESAIGGRLRFSPDSMHLYTTSKFTMAWAMPSD